MNHHRIESAAHVAVLDALTGVGVVALPHPDRDVSLGTESLYAADWDALGRRLQAMGWSLEEDDDGGWAEAGHSRDGRELVGIYHRESMDARLPLNEVALAFSEAAGAV
ncbi:MAG: hypothetical protein KBB39_14345 [Phycicoccus sp.]|nr:hypothetical protein [Phycicoccus sp.]